MKFNENFLWGVSTSAFQVEGAYREGGKGLSTTDVRNVPDGIADNSIASDHYHHYKEDVELMKELGVNVYRFSFNWARIMPDGHNVNKEGLEFYNQLINLLLDNNIKPFPTLYHFEMPQALVDEFGGWKSRKCIDAYVNYAKVCFEYFKDKVTMWGTINEQLIATNASDLNGNYEIDKNKNNQNIYQMSYHMSLAEKLVMKLAKEMIPNCRIGPVCAMQVVYSQSTKPEDVLAEKNAFDFVQNAYLDMSVYGEYPQRVKTYLMEKGYYPETKPEDKMILKLCKPDFIGVNYYSSLCVRALHEDDDISKLPPFFQNDLFTVGTNEYLEKSKWLDSGIDSQGLYIGIRDMYERYHLPVMITENGMPYSDVLEDSKVHDHYRIDYLQRHIEQCYQLVTEGYPLIGYSPWSFIDLVSTHQGFAKRYGLVFVDRTDDDPKQCKRYPKDSFYWYQKIIRNNGIES